MSFPPETVYSAINLGVMPAWLLLAIAPRSIVTRTVVHSFIYPVIYGGLYSAFLFSALFLGNSSPEGSMSSLSGVTALFSHPNGVLIGWTHYLVFDLFVGAWISRDSIQRNISHWLVLPILFLTLMFGPVGLLSYAIIRLVSGRGGLSLETNQPSKTEPS